jgi:hypothetical protein
MNTRELLYSGYYRVNEINDSAWWEGNVVVVEGDCDSCKGDDPIIKVMNHIQHQEEVKLVPAMSEYEWTQNGGSIQAMDSVINMLPNGTISQYVKLPFTQNSLCITQTINNRNVLFYYNTGLPRIRVPLRQQHQPLPHVLHLRQGVRLLTI